jgi:hypothetical protein
MLLQCPPLGQSSVRTYKSACLVQLCQIAENQSACAVELRACWTQNLLDITFACGCGASLRGGQGAVNCITRTVFLGLSYCIVIHCVRSGLWLITCEV